MRKSGLAPLLLTMVVLGGFVPSSCRRRPARLPSGEMRPDSIRSAASTRPHPDCRHDVHVPGRHHVQLTDVDPEMEMVDTGRLQSRIFDIELSGPPGGRYSWQSRVGRRPPVCPRCICEPSACPSRWLSWQPRRGGRPRTGRVPDTAQTGVRRGHNNRRLNRSEGRHNRLVRNRGNDGGLQLNTKTTAGSPAEVDLRVINTGSAALNKVAISSTKPSGIANEQWWSASSLIPSEDWSQARRER
jgi:hypothetical protein